jgi:hypothetical protein
VAEPPHEALEHLATRRSEIVAGVVVEVMPVIADSLSRVGVSKHVLQRSGRAYTTKRYVADPGG